MKCLTSAHQIKIIKMKVQYIALLGLLPIAVCAQGPVLDHVNNTPEIGSTFTVRRHLQWVDPGSAGNSQAWNFSNLIVNETVTYEVIDVAELFNAGDFPNATHLLTDGNDTLIYKIDASGWELLGDDVTFTLPPLPATDVQTQYTDGVKHLPYPAGFGDTWTDAVLGSYDLDGTVITRTGTIEGAVDGLGVVELPGSYQENILRVYTSKITSENGTGINGNRRIHTYAFHAEWLKHPLAKFVADSITVTSPFVLSNNTGRVEWLDTASVGLVEAIEQGEAFGLWPTPATDVLNITIPEGHAGRKSGILRDVTGRVVREWQIGAIGNSTFNVSDLPDGQYFLQVNNDAEELGVRKVIIR